MKYVVMVLLSAAVSLGSVATNAKTVTSPQGNANDRSVNAVAGPPPAKNVASAKDNGSGQPSKKTLKKSKITPPPPLHDPN